MISIIALLLLVMWVLFLFSIHSENSIFIYIASIGLMLISVYIMINGLEGFNNWITRGFAVIQIGVGIIGLFSPLYYELDDNDENEID